MAKVLCYKSRSPPHVWRIDFYLMRGASNSILCAAHRFLSYARRIDFYLMRGASISILCAAHRFLSDALGVFAVNLFETYVVNILWGTLEHEPAFIKGNYMIAVFLNQIKEVQTAEDSDAVFPIYLL